MLTSNEFKGLHISDFLRDWYACITLNFPKHRAAIFEWYLPPNGVLKLNFDGSSFGNLWLAGSGCIICDCFCNVVCVVCGPIDICDSIKAEVLALLIGLWELKRFGCLWEFGGTGFSCGCELG